MMKSTALNRRIWIKGLAMECPLGKAAEDCPLNGLRHLPVSQMNAAINSLTDMQVNCIVTIHNYCYHERLREVKHAMH